MLWVDAQYFCVCFQEIPTHWAQTMYTKVLTFRSWLQSHDNPSFTESLFPKC